MPSAQVESRILNLGCGPNKITDVINVDCEESINPDLCFDIRSTFPLQDESFSEVYLFHCIEHIEHFKHEQVINEVWRILDLFGKFYISYPEFSKVLQNWLDNKGGLRDFWHATIYGRQLYKGDYHFSGIHTPALLSLLLSCGFRLVNQYSEPLDDYNTVLVVEKINKPKTYQQVLLEEIF